MYRVLTTYEYTQVGDDWKRVETIKTKVVVVVVALVVAAVAAVAAAAAVVV